MHRYRILRRGLTSAIARFSPTASAALTASALVLACAMPSAAFDPDDPGLWTTPDFDSLMDFVPGSVESFNESVPQGGKSFMVADSERLSGSAAAAFADAAMGTGESADADADDDDENEGIVTMSHNGVEVIEAPDDWRGRGSYRHHAFRPERQPALGYRPHSNGWFSTGPERAPVARPGYDEYSAAGDAGEYGWPEDASGADSYARGSGSYPYSYGTDPGRPGQSILSRGWDWQDVEQDWEVDDGN